MDEINNLSSMSDINEFVADAEAKIKELIKSIETLEKEVAFVTGPDLIRFNEQITKDKKELSRLSTMVEYLGSLNSIAIYKTLKNMSNTKFKKWAEDIYPKAKAKEKELSDKSRALREANQDQYAYWSMDIYERTMQHHLKVDNDLTEDYTRLYNLISHRSTLFDYFAHDDYVEYFKSRIADCEKRKTDFCVDRETKILNDKIAFYNEVITWMDRILEVGNFAKDNNLKNTKEYFANKKAWIMQGIKASEEKLLLALEEKYLLIGINDFTKETKYFGNFFTETVDKINDNRPGRSTPIQVNDGEWHQIDCIESADFFEYVLKPYFEKMKPKGYDDFKEKFDALCEEDSFYSSIRYSVEKVDKIYFTKILCLKKEINKAMDDEQFIADADFIKKEVSLSNKDKPLSDVALNKILDAIKDIKDINKKNADIQVLLDKLAALGKDYKFNEQIKMYYAKEIRIDDDKWKQERLEDSVVQDEKHIQEMEEAIKKHLFKKKYQEEIDKAKIKLDDDLEEIERLKTNRKIIRRKVTDMKNRLGWENEEIISLYEALTGELYVGEPKDMISDMKAGIIQIQAELNKKVKRYDKKGLTADKLERIKRASHRLLKATEEQRSKIDELDVEQIRQLLDSYNIAKKGLDKTSFDEEIDKKMK